MEKLINDRITLLNKQIERQQKHADKCIGDEHEITRAKDIATKRGFVGGLKWVLENLNIPGVSNSVCPNCNTSIDDLVQKGTHVYCSKCGHEWNWD